MNYELIVILFTLLLLPGIIAAFIPGVPGLLYMLFVAAVFGFATTFSLLTVNNLLILGIIVIAAILFDIGAGIIGARYGGANMLSLLGGFFGLIVGTFIIPLPIFGSVLGFFLGIYITELSQHHKSKKAWKAAIGGVLGTLTGVAGNIVMAVVFIITFVIFALN